MQLEILMQLHAKRKTCLRDGLGSQDRLLAQVCLGEDVRTKDHLWIWEWKKKLSS